MHNETIFQFWLPNKGIPYMQGLKCFTLHEFSESYSRVSSGGKRDMGN